MSIFTSGILPLFLIKLSPVVLRVVEAGHTPETTFKSVALNTFNAPLGDLQTITDQPPLHKI